MEPVIINTQNKYTGYNRFENEFLEICNSHLKNGRAMAFAFILYDFENDNISKVLKDPEYWLSLNAISGSRLTVFSLHYSPKDFIKELMRKKLDNFSVDKEMNMFTSHINPSIQSNQLIKKYFGDDIKVKYPSVLFFQVANDRVSDYRIVELDEEKLEDSFSELKKYIKAAAEAISYVSDENKVNTDAIFDLIDNRIRQERQTIVARKGISKLTSITELASTIVGLGK